MSNNVVHIYGTISAGTNLLRFVLENNFKNLRADYGNSEWKHSPVSSKQANDASINVAVVRDYHSSLLSWYSHVRQSNKNFVSQASDFSEFIRSSIVLRDNNSKHPSSYRFSSPIEMWNFFTHNYINSESIDLVCCYDDLKDNTDSVIDLFKGVFNFSENDSRIYPHNVYIKKMSNGYKRDSKEDYLSQPPSHKKVNINDISPIDQKYIDDNVFNELKPYFKKTLIPIDDSYTLITVGSASRLKDMEVLLNSNALNDNAHVKVIPFNDSDIEDLINFLKPYNASILLPNDYWDNLGRSIYGNENYRKGVESWRYFRKLNALNLADKSNIIFVDANCAIFDSLKPLVNISENYSILFGTKAAKDRNFSKLGYSLLSKEYGHGYNAGLWSVRKGSDFASKVKEFSKLGGVRSLLSMSPEQSFISAAIAYYKLSSATISDASLYYNDLLPISHLNSKRLKVRGECTGTFKDRLYFDNKAAPIFKWTGTDNILSKDHPLNLYLKR